MLIECIDSPVKIDGNDILKGVRLNVAPNNQLRLKLTYLFEESELPVDIVVFNYSSKVDMLSMGISIVGKEMNQNINFKVWLGRNFLDQKWTLKGTVGAKQVSRQMMTSLEIIQVIKDLVEPYKHTAKK